jgi:peptide/nickel transport system substrate-binding protein
MAFGAAWQSLRRGVLAGALVLLVAAGDPALAAPSGLPHPDDELVIGVPETITALHPMSYTLYEDFTLDFAHRRLVMPDQSWHLACGLCTALPSLENGRIKLVPGAAGGQGMEVTYTLQPEARWADGEPVTSLDAAFTVEVARLPDSGLPNAVLFRNLRSVRVVDAKTFALVYDHVEFGLSAPDALEFLPEHIDGPIFRALADKRDYLKHSAYRTEPTNPGLWMGPYRLAEFGAGKYAVFERNPHWFGDKPYFRKITLRFYPSSAQAEAGLFAGETDLLQEGTLPLAVAADIRARLQDRFVVKTAPSATLFAVAVNLDQPQLEDARVRRALLLAIDRKAMARELFGDEQVVAQSFLPPEDPGYSPDIPKFPYDPAAAVKALRDAGYKQNEAGRLVDAAGAPLELRLSTYAGNSLTRPVGERLVAAWQRLGIGVTLVSDPALLTQTLPHRRFELALFSQTPTPEYVPQTILGSSAIPGAANNYSGSNFAGLRDPAIDSALAALSGELDARKRRDLWAGLQAAWAEALPALPLFDLPQLYVVPNWLRGFEPTGHAIASSNFCENWSRRP